MKQLMFLLVLLFTSAAAHSAECTVTQATVSVKASTEREDGKPFSPEEIGGFRFYYGESEGNYNNKLDVPTSEPMLSTCIEKSSNPLFLVVTVYDKDGRESQYTDVEIIEALPPIELTPPLPPLIIQAYSQATVPPHTVIMEAENYHLRINRDHSWTPTADAGGMEALPNIDQSFDPVSETVEPFIDYVNNSPRLDYLVNFSQAGTHYVWVKGGTQSSSVTPGRDNSVHIGIGAQTANSVERITFETPLEIDWSNVTMTGTAASIDVPYPGLHIVSAWMREDGFIMDKILLTTDSGLICPNIEVCQ